MLMGEGEISPSRSVTMNALMQRKKIGVGKKDSFSWVRVKSRPYAMLPFFFSFATATNSHFISPHRNITRLYREIGLNGK